MSFVLKKSVFTATSLVAGSLLAASAKKPNIVLIYADDLGYGDLSCQGATKLQTPNIDKLATDGLRFTDAHSPSAVCTPSRYGLLTGRYPFRRNIVSPVFLKSKLIIKDDRVTIADMAKKAGYSTACVGKWHLGFGNTEPTDWNKTLKPGPLECGFDYFFGVPVVNSHPPFVYMENRSIVDYDPSDPFVYGKQAKTKEIPAKKNTNHIGGADAAHAAYDDYKVGTMLKNKALAWIRKEKNNPFFLYFPTTNIHHPFTPAKQFQGTSQCGRYGDFVHELDWIVGEVVKTLEEEGLADNTMIVFTSDNGGMFNPGGQDAWKDGHKLNGELLGSKFGVWEGGHRVPFIIKWPGVVKAGQVTNSLVSAMDLFSTFTSIWNEPLKEGVAEDSISLLPILTENKDTVTRNELIYCPFKTTHLAMRRGDWVYIPAQDEGGFGGRKLGEQGFSGAPAVSFMGKKNSDISNGKVKSSAPRTQLYNLKKDLKQEQNVVNDHPEVAKELQAELNRRIVRDSDALKSAVKNKKKSGAGKKNKNKKKKK